MLTSYGLRDGRVTQLTQPAPSRADVVWIDLHDPSHNEEKAVEALLGLQVPNCQEMAEIGESARLYEERAADEMAAADLNEVSTRSPTHKAHPYSGGGEFDGCEEGVGVLLVSGCDSAVVLEL